MAFEILAFEVVGQNGHGIKKCSEINIDDHNKADEDHPLSLVLKAESSMVGKESVILGSIWKKSMKQCFYIGKGTVKKRRSSFTGKVESISSAGGRRYSKGKVCESVINGEEESNKNWWSTADIPQVNSKDMRPTEEGEKTNTNGYRAVVDLNNKFENEEPTNPEELS
ncbi:hypothetical protein J1N35_000872 [Gossypium stocksii]|uniref:Uncharacterized protein n=1 Tax=Gossypium stocksii TaxID=47602 RepID=A0A9D3WIW6_9ROSI|nr:hypothetical protein J1N35_000872 [Gossypium stocksii]